MKVLGAANSRKSYEIATCITFRVLFVNSGSGVQGLMKISNVMDQETERV